MKVLVFIGISLWLFLSCNPSKQLAKKKIQQEQLIAIENSIDTKQYAIEITAVYPFITNATAQVLNGLLLQGAGGHSAGRIDVNKQGYFIKITDDKSKADLPFFGERRITKAYGNDTGGIIFDDHYRNYTVLKNDKNKSLVINYEINDATESYGVYITVFASKKVSITINSSHTANISYEGLFTAL